MTWAVNSLEDARTQLEVALRGRIDISTLKAVNAVRIPVAFLWVPAHLPEADDCVRTFSFWNSASGRYFDIVFMGWAEDGGQLIFNDRAYRSCAEEVRNGSKWRESGGVDLLLLHFQYDPTHYTGAFNFSEAIPLPVSEMIHDKKVASVYMLMQKLINAARDTYAPGEVDPLWEIQDYLAFERGRRSAWEWISNTFLKGAGKIYDEMRPYYVCNLAL